MPKLSPHRLKGKIIRIRRGLALYQTYASPFYFARILDPRNQRYKVRSTKETNRVEARKVADEYAHQITRRDAPADKEFSSGHPGARYARDLWQPSRGSPKPKKSATPQLSGPTRVNNSTFGRESKLSWQITCVQHHLMDPSASRATERTRGLNSYSSLISISEILRSHHQRQ